MRTLWRPLPFLIPALTLALATAPTLADGASPVALHERDAFDTVSYLQRRDGHGHGHSHSHAQPLLELNETEVVLYHQPTPPSYYSIDFMDRNSDESRHPGFMGLHILFMSLAFFGALPVGTPSSFPHA